MPWKKGKEGKEFRTYKLNKVGAKIATYHKLALIMHCKTFEVVKYGELDEMRKYIDEKYYHHPQYHHRTFQYFIYYSDNWRIEALEKLIDKFDPEFASELDYPDTDHLFVEEEEKGIGHIYHGWTIAGDPPLDYWKEQEKRWQTLRESRGETAEAEDEAAEKRRQRSLKAAETMRKKREAALKKENEQG